MSNQKKVQPTKELCASPSIVQSLPEPVVQQQSTPIQAYQRVCSPLRVSSPDDMYILQRTMGNQSVQKLLKKPTQSRTSESDQKVVQPVQRKQNATGLPDDLKARIEAISALPMDDVQVHYHSSRPAQVQALAYTQGTDIYVGPGQEQHLAHEAWHVVQQKQGRVQPTVQTKGIAINDDQVLEREADVMGARAEKKDTCLLPLGKIPQNNSEQEETTLRSLTHLGSPLLIQRKLTPLDEANLEVYYNFLLDIRGLAKNAYATTFQRAIEDFDTYLDAATFLSFHLPVAPTKVAVAREFVSALTAMNMGLHPYLAGGAAIALQGGKRPISDLDFRIDTRKGLQNFGEAEGQAILQHLNRVVLPRSKNRREDLRGVQFADFSATGEDKLTIGTKSWFGYAVSLTIHQGWPHLAPTEIIPASSGQTAIMALQLVDLLQDKLKSVITRTQKEQDNIKKVAQDLFDVLDTMRLLQVRSQQVPSQGHTLMRWLGWHLLKRVPQYRVANLEIERVAEELNNQRVALRMLERLILTAQAHVTTEPRAIKFEQLALKYAVDLLDDVKVLASLDVNQIRAFPISDMTPERFWQRMYSLLRRINIGGGYHLPDEVIKLIISYAGREDLMAWFATWNETGTPPKKRYALQADKDIPVALQPPDENTSIALQPIDENTPVALILARWPREEEPTNSEQILFILGQTTKGFRTLKNLTSDEILAAFGLTKNQFNRAWKILGKDGFVEAQKEGAKLTDKGREEYKKLFP